MPCCITFSWCSRACWIKIIFLSVKLAAYHILYTRCNVCHRCDCHQRLLEQRSIARHKAAIRVHLRHAGLQILTLSRVKLDSAGFQELGKLEQLQQLSLIGIVGRASSADIRTLSSQHLSSDFKARRGVSAKEPGSSAQCITHQTDHTQIQMLASVPNGPTAAVLLQSMLGSSHSQGTGQVRPGSNCAGESNSKMQRRLGLPGPGQLIQTSTALQLPDRPFAHFTESLQFCAGLDSLHSILPHTDRGNVETLLEEALAYIQRLQHTTQQLESDWPHAFQTTQFPLDPVDNALESLSQLVPNPPATNAPRPPCRVHDKGGETAAMLEQAIDYTLKLRHRTQQLESGLPEAVQMMQPATASVGASSRVDSDSPFWCLGLVTSLKLSEYTSAELPALDLLGMTQLRNLKHLTLLEIRGVDVPYCELASLSKLTFLETDMSQSEESWQSLPALTNLQRLSVACTRPDMPQFQLCTEFTNLLGLTRLDLTEVDKFLPEQLESLKLLPALEHFAVVGKNMQGQEEKQPQQWRDPIAWKALSALTALKHLALINIDHKDGIFNNICSLTCLTFLDLFSLRNIYKSSIGKNLMLLSSLPSLDHLQCEFYIYDVRSDLYKDLESRFRYLRSEKLPAMAHLQVHFHVLQVWDMDCIDSDDVNSDYAALMESHREGEEHEQEAYEAEYDSDERRMHAEDAQWRRHIY